MSEQCFYHAISLLLAGKYDEMIAKYYGSRIELKLNETVQLAEKTFGLGLIKQALISEQAKVLQFKVADIQKQKNELRYNIFMVTKNIHNEIEFSKHRIRNRWQNNLVCHHDHNITNH